MAAPLQAMPNGLNKATSIVLKYGRFDLTSKSDLDGIFSAVSQALGKPLVVHFHGGLVDLQQGINGANWLETVYSAAGATPMFFIWVSGSTEIIEQNIQQIFQETIFKQILLRVTQFAKAKVDQLASPKGAAAKGIGLLHPDSDSDVLDEIEKLKADDSQSALVTLPVQRLGCSLFLGTPEMLKIPDYHQSPAQKAVYQFEFFNSTHMRTQGWVYADCERGASSAVSRKERRKGCQTYR
jgi:hypothetical protein